MSNTNVIQHLVLSINLTGMVRKFVFLHYRYIIVTHITRFLDVWSSITRLHFFYAVVLFAFNVRWIDPLSRPLLDVYQMKWCWLINHTTELEESTCVNVIEMDCSRIIILFCLFEWNIGYCLVLWIKVNKWMFSFYWHLLYNWLLTTKDSQNGRFFTCGSELAFLRSPTLEIRFYAYNCCWSSLSTRVPCYCEYRWILLFIVVHLKWCK